MKLNDQYVTLCGKQLHGLRHICAFFESENEQYDILTPYLKEGIDIGDRVVTILESDSHLGHFARLESAGIGTSAAIEREQLMVLKSEDSYLKDGIFVVERMCKMLEDAITSAENSEFKHVRTMGDMDWALRGCPGTDELIVYEARVNEIAPRHDCTLLCAYDINKFSGRVIADVLATHSHVLMGGQIYENPHYVEPLEYLKKLASRRGAVSPRRDN